jgi:hypothetical protein
MTVSLNDRFKSFLYKLPFVEAIDNLELSPEYDESKRADFLIENRKVIIEIKSLESDPEHKIHADPAKHQERNEYPLFYGVLELNKVFTYPSDGGQKNQNLIYQISRSIDQSFREADKQICATKEIFNCPDSIGLLVLLNENISLLSPEIISCSINQLLAKTDDDGSPHFKSITSVWLIMESFSLKTRKGDKLLPSIVIDGPRAAELLELTSILNVLQSKWAEFNGVSYVTANIGKIVNSDFISPSEIEKEHQQFMPKHELWRKQYSDSRYLKSLSDGAVLTHGARLLSFMTPNYLKDGYRIPFDQMAQLMEGWTHFLEEVQIRGLDLKNMPDRLSVCSSD